MIAVTDSYRRRMDLDPVRMMSVNQLLEGLINEGLDVDGTKEMLISRLMELTDTE